MAMTRRRMIERFTTGTSICIYPKRARAFAGYRLQRNGLDVTMKHLESDREFEMSGAFLKGNGEDIVRLDRNETSNAMTLMLVRPVDQFFPNLVEDFGGTLEVTGVATLVEERRDGNDDDDDVVKKGAAFRFRMELVEPTTAPTPRPAATFEDAVLELSSCVCRSMASSGNATDEDNDGESSSSSSTALEEEGGELIIGGAIQRCLEHDRIESTPPLSVCMFPGDEDASNFEGYRIPTNDDAGSSSNRGLNLTMTHLESGRTLTVIDGEVLAYKKIPRGTQWRSPCYFPSRRCSRTWWWITAGRYGDPFCLDCDRGLRDII